MKPIIFKHLALISITLLPWHTSAQDPCSLYLETIDSVCIYSYGNSVYKTSPGFPYGILPDDLKNDASIKIIIKKRFYSGFINKMNEVLLDSSKKEVKEPFLDYREADFRTSVLLIEFYGYNENGDKDMISIFFDHDRDYIINKCNYIYKSEESMIEFVDKYFKSLLTWVPRF